MEEIQEISTAPCLPVASSVIDSGSDDRENVHCQMSVAEKWLHSANVPGSMADSLAQYVWHFDMLNDSPRNAAYDGALKLVVQSLSDAAVLDIGTGSGLLACLARKHGASHVTAIEMDGPVAMCAVENILQNNMDKHIRVINDTSMSPSVRLPERCDVVVAELLDSALLGEEFIPVLRDASRKGWLKPNCRIIPARASVYGQLVESKYLRNMGSFDEFGDFPFSVPEALKTSSQSRAPYDCPISALLASGQARFLSEPFHAWDIDFESLPPQEGRSKILDVPVSTSGRLDAVLFFWDLFLDQEGQFSLSSRPQLLGAQLSHQDHWLQAFTLLPQALHVDPAASPKISLNLYQDDRCIWFDIASDSKKDKEIVFTFDTDRVSQLNSSSFISTIDRSFSKAILEYLQLQKHHELLNVVHVGDGPLLPMMLAKKIKNACGSLPYQIFSLESSEGAKEMSVEYFAANDMISDITTKSEEPDLFLRPNSVGFLCAEPFFEDEKYSQNWGRDTLFRYWLSIDALQPFLCENTIVLPSVAVLRFALIQCYGLWNARKPCVSDIHGVDLKAINTLHSYDKTDAVQMWRYEYNCLSDAVSSLSMNLLQSPTEASHQTISHVTITCDGKCHALVMWIEYDADARTKKCDKAATEERDNIFPSSILFESGISLDSKKVATPYLQGIRYLENPMDIRVGDIVDVISTVNVAEGILESTVSGVRR